MWKTFSVPTNSLSKRRKRAEIKVVVHHSRRLCYQINFFPGRRWTNPKCINDGRKEKERILSCAQGYCRLFWMVPHVSKHSPSLMLDTTENWRRSRASSVYGNALWIPRRAQKMSVARGFSIFHIFGLRSIIWKKTTENLHWARRLSHSEPLQTGPLERLCLQEFSFPLVPRSTFQSIGVLDTHSTFGLRVQKTPFPSSHF